MSVIAHVTGNDVYMIASYMIEGSCGRGLFIVKVVMGCGKVIIGKVFV